MAEEGEREGVDTQGVRDSVVSQGVTESVGSHGVRESVATLPADPRDWSWMYGNGEEENESMRG